MERFKQLGRYQKGILLFMAAMVLLFTALYSVTIGREGFEYQDAILIASQENGNTIYSGKIDGKLSRFTVYSDKTVKFQYGEKTYGPYTAKEDPTAIPKDSELAEDMIGIELRDGEKLLFRGGLLSHGGSRWLYNEDGSLENLNISVTTNYGIVMDENGNAIDPMEPSVSTVLDLMAGPDLTHKGDWLAWFLGVLFCAATAVSILFIDELFRWNLSFQIRNADRAEPSDWEIATRYISWTVFPLMALIIFIVGLQ